MNYFSKNLRYLRKSRGLSQQELADALNIRRSNIAAYETKNVEPRLSLINSIAELMEVTLGQLICVDLSKSGGKSPADESPTGMAAGADYAFNSTQAAALRQQSIDIRSMLEGFRIFFSYKKNIATQTEEQTYRAITDDVENFLIFIDQMLKYNEQIIRMLDELGVPNSSALTKPSNWVANGEISASDSSAAVLRNSKG